MKTLPKYFCIKRDAENPLWRKYIDWLNKTYNIELEGNSFEFYGYDGNNLNCNGNDCWDNISDFKNNPTLLTLEEWNDIINGEEEGEEFIAGEQVAISDVSIEQAIENLKTDSYQYYYIGKKKDGDYVIEDNDGDLNYYKYIAKIPKETKTELTMQEIADKFGIEVSNLKIKE